MEPRHERIARIALAAGGRYGLALAGGYAVSAHGMGSRPSGDVDLFTSWQRRGEFAELAAAVIAALESAGYKASVIMSAETFRRLILTDSADGSEEKVELSVDWRAHEPVQLDVGPVLHPDDAVANKVCALFGRALPRDFLDVDAAVVSGRYTRDQLLEQTPRSPNTAQIQTWSPTCEIGSPNGGENWSPLTSSRPSALLMAEVRTVGDPLPNPRRKSAPPLRAAAPRLRLDLVRCSQADRVTYPPPGGPSSWKTFR
jgi:hypothetical protein